MCASLLWFSSPCRLPARRPLLCPNLLEGSSTLWSRRSALGASFRQTRSDAAAGSSCQGDISSIAVPSGDASTGSAALSSGLASDKKYWVVLHGVFCLCCELSLTMPQQAQPISQLLVLPRQLMPRMLTLFVFRGQVQLFVPAAPGPLVAATESPHADHHDVHAASRMSAHTPSR